MPLILAIVFIAGTAFASARHDGVLKKGGDTTYRDTVAFELHAAELTEQNSHEEAARLKAILKTEEASPLGEDGKKKSVPDIEPGI